MVSQKAQTIAELLVKEFISHYSVPLIIHIDQGWKCELEFFAEVCKLLDITKTRTSHTTLSQMAWSNTSTEPWRTCCESFEITTRGTGISTFQCS